MVEDEDVVVIVEGVVLADAEVDVVVFVCCCVWWVEGCVGCFGWVWDEVVGVEVVDEAAEF